ncbi:metallophosphoesterase family protein [Aquirhabdus sp.]|uniref:metallophosphoesterase family protein n=1 Tax=Aquirhabdus sp. TaxID=2824160 RepID=UPI00396CDAF7
MLLHLSDVHFGAEQDTVTDALRKLCDSLPLEAIAISGDLTQRARRSQFQAFFNFFNTLGVPWLVVPGNHDIPLYHLPKRVFSPFGHYESVFGDTEKMLETKHFHLVGVNSISPKHHTRGRLTPHQIERIGERLKLGAIGKHRVILSHQPFRVLRPYQERDIPTLVVHAAQHWADCGLDALLHGHFHVPVVLPLQTHFGLSKEVLDIQAGTAVSHRLRYDVPNSVNIIHPDLTVDRYDYNLHTKQFERSGQLWPLQHDAHQESA